jgi:tyrosyl-tRNA synthetase
MIGDPSGKSTERPLLQQQILENNQRGIEQDMRRCLKGDVTIVNNYDWFGRMSVIDFMREIGKTAKIQQMLAKDVIQSRLTPSSTSAVSVGAGSAAGASTGEEGLSFAEFSYQLFQAGDFLHLNRNFNCTVQIGGSDQWGNITSGIELVRKSTSNEVFGLTLPLLTTSNGVKFGKSAGNAIWLNETKTIPYALYQYLLQTSDADVERFLKIFTFIELSEIDAIVRRHSASPESRTAQRKLAGTVVEFIHGADALVAAEKASELLFTSEFASLTAAQLRSVLGDVPTFGISREEVIQGNVTLVSAMLLTKSAPTKNEAKRTIASGGLYVNNIRVEADRRVTLGDFVEEKLCVMRIGKKNQRLIEIN